MWNVYGERKHNRILFLFSVQATEPQRCEALEKCGTDHTDMKIEQWIELKMRTEDIHTVILQL